MSNYTTITVDPTGSTDTDEATQALVDDMNKIYADAYNLGLSQEDLDYALSVMTGDSGTNSLKGLVDIIGVLTVECNSISGALVLINDTMNVISDTTNLMSTAMSSYTNLADYFSDPTNTAVTDTQIDELNTFDSSINVFLSTTFTVTYADGTTTDVDGLLTLLSTPDYWPGGKAPMGTQTADLITTSIKGIEGTFGDDWADPNEPNTDGNNQLMAMMSDIELWSQPKAYTSTDSNGVTTDTGVYGSYTQNSDIEQNMNSVDDQLTTTTSTLQNYESEGMALYQQFQSYEEDDIQSIKDQQATMISNQLA